MIALPRLAGRLFGAPLAIERSKLDVIVAAVAPRILGTGALEVYDDETDENTPERAPLTTHTSDGIALISIYGTLVSKSAGVDSMSGLTTYPDIARAFNSAIADPAVRGIVLDIDSPGGEVRGMFDLAETIASARGKKPIAAAAAPAASSAYLLASATDGILVARDASVGSIGVLCLHLDQSGADAKAGLKYTTIFAGSHKNDGNPHEPLTDSALSRLQANVDTIYSQFVAAVAANRRMSVESIRGTQALTYLGIDGVTAGLADSVGNAGDALALVRNALQGKRLFSAALAAHRRPMQSIAGTAAEDPVTQPQAAQLPVAAAPPVPVAAPAATHADLEQIRAAARNEAAAEVAHIHDLCTLAGHSELASGFVANRTSAAEVRKQLLQARVNDSGPAVSGIVMPGVDAHNKAKGAPEEMKAKPWDEIGAEFCRPKGSK